MTRMTKGDDAVLAEHLLRKMGVRFEGPGDEMVQHARVLIEVLRLVESKRQGYRSAWKAVGYLGTVIKVKGKTERLMNLLWYTSDKDRDRPVLHESVEDSWLDLLVYAMFGVQQWRWRDPRGRQS